MFNARIKTSNNLRKQGLKRNGVLKWRLIVQRSWTENRRKNNNCARSKMDLKPKVLKEMAHWTLYSRLIEWRMCLFIWRHFCCKQQKFRLWHRHRRHPPGCVLLVCVHVTRWTVLSHVEPPSDCGSNRLHISQKSCGLSNSILIMFRLYGVAVLPVVGLWLG